MAKAPLQESASRFWVVHPKRVGDQYKIITLADAVAEWERLGYRVEGPFVPLADAEKLATALASLRAAWNEHMKTCQQHADAPTFAEIDAWMNAPSNTASGPREETTD